MDLYFYREKRDGYTRFSAEFPYRGDDCKLYLEVPVEYADSIVHYEDALVVLSLYWLMEEGGEVNIHAEINRDLLFGLHEYSRIWSYWMPSRYHPLVFRADSSVVRPYRTGNREGIIAYSGGVDAAYCFARCLSGEEVVRAGAAVLIHGADIPLSESSVFGNVYTQHKAVLKEFRVPLIPVRTNCRQYPHDWEHCFYSVVCAVLLLFSDKYAHGVMGTDQTCRRETLQLPWGENPITDQYYSTPFFRMHPMGVTAGRTERCSLLCRYPILVDNIRVCWQADAGGGNCGVCDKCIRTQLNFMACGYTGPLPFREPFSINSLRKLPRWDSFHGAYFEDILDWNDRVTHALPEDNAKEIRKRLRAGRTSRQAEQLVRILRITGGGFSLFKEVICIILNRLSNRLLGR